MSKGEQLYLAMVIAVFCGWGLWMFYLTLRYDRTRKGPEARLARDEQHAYDALPHGAAAD
jgi:hypothetical protein